MEVDFSQVKEIKSVEIARSNLPESLHVSIGSEYYVVKYVVVRAGYKYRSGGNDLGGLDGLSAGLGVNIKSYSLDYAFVPFGEFDSTHRVSLGLKW